MTNTVGRTCSSLVGRATLASVGLVLATALTVGAATTWQVYDATRDELNQRIIDDGRLLAEAVSSAWQHRNLREVEALLAAAVKHEDVAAARFLAGPEQRIVAERGRMPAFDFANLPVHDGSSTAKTGAYLFAALAVTCADLDDCASVDPPGAHPRSHAATLQLAYTLGPIHYVLARHVLVGLSITALVAVLAGGLALVALRRLLRPLAELAEAAVAFGDGARWIRVREDRAQPDEIRQLSHCFNEMAERLSEAMDRQESAVEQRTADLIRASKAKDDFLANMSHEIRTPMTAIIGYADALAEAGPSGPEQSEAIRAIGRNGDHLLQIINDILDLAKVESGRMKIEPKRCNPLAIVEELIAGQRLSANDKGLALNLKLRTSVPAVIRTDEVRLRQILVNLLGNAVKFTEAGGVTVTLGLWDMRGPIASPRMYFSVADTGVGIPAEKLPDVFQAFTQVDETMSRCHGGTGLGLTISRRLARLLGGDLHAESVVGHGSVFTLVLPTGPLDGVERIAQPMEAGENLRSSSSRSYAEQTSPVTVPNAPDRTAPLAGRRILLAEDGPDNRRILSVLLKRAGAQVVQSENGAVAVEQCLAALHSARCFDLVLMDMQMPVLDGYEATRQLRAAGYTAPIIAITAHAMSGDRERCLAAGCDDYLSKPVKRDALLALLTRRCAACAPAGDMVQA